MYFVSSLRVFSLKSGINPVLSSSFIMYVFFMRSVFSLCADIIFNVSSIRGIRFSTVCSSNMFLFVVSAILRADSIVFRSFTFFRRFFSLKTSVIRVLFWVK